MKGERCPTCLRVPPWWKPLTTTQRVLELLSAEYPDWMTTEAIAARVEEIGGHPVLLSTVRTVLMREQAESRWYANHSAKQRGRQDCKEYRWVR